MIYIRLVLLHWVCMFYGNAAKFCNRRFHKNVKKFDKIGERFKVGSR